MSMKISANELSQKIVEKNKELVRISKQFNQEITKLKEENVKLLKQKILLSTEEKHKHALKLYANNFAVGEIHKMMTTEYGIDISLSEVRILVDKADFLSDELRDYYNKEKKEFAQKVKIDKGIFASSIYKKFELLANALSEQLQEARDMGDSKLTLSCIAELKNIYKEMTSVFFKGGMEGTIDVGMENNMEAYENQKKETQSKIVKFKGVKVI